MAISCSLATVADSISKLSISGITIRDIDALATSWLALPNVLYPRPDGFVSNISVTATDMARGGYELRYTLTYRYLFTQLGNDAVLFAGYATFMANLVLIINSIITNHNLTGAIDLTLGGVSVGPLQDPAGNMYHGADIQINVLEFLTL